MVGFALHFVFRVTADAAHREVPPQVAPNERLSLINEQDKGAMGNFGEWIRA